MNNTAKDIFFDFNGVCNYCKEFININNINDKKETLDNFLARVKAEGVNLKYDCIVGVSGGVDSSYALIKAVELGLRPLAVHMDNGWNSELAQNNISCIVKKLNVDLFTYVINWEDYRKLMQSFFNADVIDIEYNDAYAIYNNYGTGVGP